jgi:hypothetical protein
VKRVVKLLVPLGVLAAVLAWLQRRPAPPSASPTAPPEPVQRPASYEAPVVTPSAAAGEPPEEDAVESHWAEPTADGGCPDGYPVKAKTSSKIFHAPGGTMYERTVPDRCYPSAEAAEADGYRASKR